MLLLAVMFVVLGLLLSAISIPMVLRRVKPNGLYGFRPPTIGSPDIWYPANAYAGRLLFGAGLTFTAAAVVFALVPGISEDQYALACLFVLMAGLLVMRVLSLVYLNRLNKRQEKS